MPFANIVPLRGRTEPVIVVDDLFVQADQLFAAVGNDRIDTAVDERLPELRCEEENDFVQTLLHFHRACGKLPVQAALRSVKTSDAGMLGVGYSYIATPELAVARFELFNQGCAKGSALSFYDNPRYPYTPTTNFVRTFTHSADYGENHTYIDSPHRSPAKMRDLSDRLKTARQTFSEAGLGWRGKMAKAVEGTGRATLLVIASGPGESDRS